jgi:hypothetical protein
MTTSTTALMIMTLSRTTLSITQRECYECINHTYHAELYGVILKGSALLDNPSKIDYFA